MVLKMVDQKVRHLVDCWADHWVPRKVGQKVDQWAQK